MASTSSSNSPGGDSLRRRADHVGGTDRAGDRGRGGRACLSSGRAVAQVRAQERADPAALRSPTEVDVRLLYVALELGVAQPVVRSPVASRRSALGRSPSRSSRSPEDPPGSRVSCSRMSFPPPAIAAVPAAATPATTAVNATSLSRPFISSPPEDSWSRVLRPRGRRGSKKSAGSEAGPEVHHGVRAPRPPGLGEPQGGAAPGGCPRRSSACRIPTSPGSQASGSPSARIAI